MEQQKQRPGAERRNGRNEKADLPVKKLGILEQENESKEKGIAPT